MLPTGLGLTESRHDALTDHLPLVLRHRGEDVAEEAASWGGRVHVRLTGRDNVYPPGQEILDNCD
jgi:hypothetical protein